MEIYVNIFLFSYFLFFLVFKRDFIECLDFTRILASITVRRLCATCLHPPADMPFVTFAHERSMRSITQSPERCSRRDRPAHGESQATIRAESVQ